jgi:hypothetical protein
VAFAASSVELPAVLLSFPAALAASAAFAGLFSVVGFSVMPPLLLLLSVELPVLLAVALDGIGTVTLTSSVRSRMTSALSKLTIPLESALCEGKDA